MIKEVEELSTEFDVPPFADGGPLEHRPVEVSDALLTQTLNPPELVSRSPSRGAGAKQAMLNQPPNLAVGLPDTDLLQPATTSGLSDPCRGPRPKVTFPDRRS